MSFELVERGEWQKFARLEEGQAALSCDGRLVLRREDLELVGITTAALVFADTGSLRLALRKPRNETEAHRAMNVGVVKRGKLGDSGRRGILVARAIKRLNLEPRACAGRYQLISKEDLLILNLADIEFGPAAEKE